MWEDGKVVGREMRHEHTVESVAFSPAGRWIASGSRDRTVRLGSATGEPVGRRIRRDSPVRAVAFRSDGTRLAVGCVDGTARIWDVGFLSGTPLPAELLRRAQKATGFRLDARGEVEFIPAGEWRLSCR